jgi:hypothetical protein
MDQQAMTPTERGDWRIVANALKAAKQRLERDGARETWLDTPLAIAEQYAGAIAPTLH